MTNPSAVAAQRSLTFKFAGQRSYRLDAIDMLRAAWLSGRA